MRNWASRKASSRAIGNASGRSTPKRYTAAARHVKRHKDQIEDMKETGA